MMHTVNEEIGATPREGRNTRRRKITERPRDGVLDQYHASTERVARDGGNPFSGQQVFFYTEYDDTVGLKSRERPTPNRFVGLGHNASRRVHTPYIVSIEGKPGAEGKPFVDSAVKSLGRSRFDVVGLEYHPGSVGNVHTLVGAVVAAMNRGDDSPYVPLRDSDPVVGPTVILVGEGSEGLVDTLRSAYSGCGLRFVAGRRNVAERNSGEQDRIDFGLGE